MRDGNRQPRQLLLEDALDRLLVCGADVGEKERQRDRLGALVADRLAQCAHVVLDDRSQRLARGVQTLVEAKAEATAGDERLRLLPAQVVEDLAVDSLDERRI